MQGIRSQMKISQRFTAAESPRSLLNALWLNNCIYFGMRSGKEQRDLCWGDLQLKTDSEGNRFVEFSQERQTKTRTGENPRNVREKKPQMYENKNNADRCPIDTCCSLPNALERLTKE